MSSSKYEHILKENNIKSCVVKLQRSHFKKYEIECTASSSGSKTFSLSKKRTIETSEMIQKPCKSFKGIYTIIKSLNIFK